MGRRRAIALWVLAIAGAAWRYVADGYAPFDPCRAGFAFDPDHGTLADVPAAVRRLDGRAAAVEGLMVPIDPADPIEHFALEPSIYSGPRGAAPAPRSGRGVRRSGHPAAVPLGTGAGVRPPARPCREGRRLPPLPVPPGGDPVGAGRRGPDLPVAVGRSRFGRTRSRGVGNRAPPAAAAAMAVVHVPRETVRFAGVRLESLASSRPAAGDRDDAGDRGHPFAEAGAVERHADECGPAGAGTIPGPRPNGARRAGAAAGGRTTGEGAMASRQTGRWIGWLGLLSLVAAGPRATADLNAGWRFLRSDSAGAEAPAFDDAAWQAGRPAAHVEQPRRPGRRQQLLPGAGVVPPPPRLRPAPGPAARLPAVRRGRTRRRRVRQRHPAGRTRGVRRLLLRRDAAAARPATT